MISSGETLEWLPEPRVSVERIGVVLRPDGSDQEIEGVLNPGIARDRNGTVLMFPRMVAAGNRSSIGIARRISSGEPHFERLGIVLRPEAEYELRTASGGQGCEDARVTFLPRLDKYVMCYTAFGPLGARIALAVSDDAYSWRRLGLVNFPGSALNARDNKDSAFFPEPVYSPGGVYSYAFYHRPMLPSTINGQTPIPIIMALDPSQREATCLGYVPVEAVDRDIANLIHPAESAVVLDVGKDWGTLKNGAGTPPIRTSRGWLAFFHGVDPVERDGALALSYGAGIVVHDADRPHIVRYRSPEPILRPITVTERFGVVNDVVFPTGIEIVSDDTFDVYYGAADSAISLARIQVSFPD